MYRVLLISAFCITVSFSSFSQTASIDPVTQKTIFTLVDEFPEFPGGETGLSNYISQNIIYPDTALKKGIEGLVYVSFIVGTEGDLQDIKVVNGKSPELNEEALRVVRAMPKWKPGTINGEKVDVMFQLPIRFNLKKDEL